MIKVPARTPRIVGGKPADADEWPWMAALLCDKTDQFCGGVLITDQHVLTASSCVDMYYLFPKYRHERMSGVILIFYYSISNPNELVVPSSCTKSLVVERWKMTLQ